MSRENGYSQKAENSVVPFPREKVLGPDGQLETYIKNLTDFPEIASLPEELSSTSIESYANWLAKLTIKGGKKKERGAFIHLDARKDTFIFPSNPKVGEYGSVLSEIGIGSRFIPLIRIHSHPDQTSFSPQDLKWAISSPIFFFEMLSSQGQNFLLVRTKETEIDDVDKVGKRMDEIKDEMINSRRKLFKVFREHELPKEIADLFEAVILGDEIAEFGSDYVSYLLTYVATYRAAREHKIGFYVSNKDGVYRVFGEGQLTKIEEKGLQIIHESFDKLATGNF